MIILQNRSVTIALTAFLLLATFDAQIRPTFATERPTDRVEPITINLNEALTATNLPILIFEQEGLSIRDVKNHFVRRIYFLSWETVDAGNFPPRFNSRAIRGSVVNSNKQRIKSDAAFLDQPIEVPEYANGLFKVEVELDNQPFARFTDTDPIALPIRGVVAYFPTFISGDFQTIEIEDDEESLSDTNKDSEQTNELEHYQDDAAFVYASHQPRAIDQLEIVVVSAASGLELDEFRSVTRWVNSRVPGHAIDLLHGQYDPDFGRIKITGTKMNADAFIDEVHSEPWLSETAYFGYQFNSDGSISFTDRNNDVQLTLTVNEKGK